MPLVDHAKLHFSWGIQTKKSHFSWGRRKKNHIFIGEQNKSVQARYPLLPFPYPNME